MSVLEAGDTASPTRDTAATFMEVWETAMQLTNTQINAKW